MLTEIYVEVRSWLDTRVRALNEEGAQTVEWLALGGAIAAILAAIVATGSDRKIAEALAGVIQGVFSKAGGG